MAERVRVRRLTDEEGRKLQRLVRRGEGKGQASVVRYRRAMVVLASAGGNTVPVIAQLVHTCEDRVREVIHRFNDMGLACLDPKWAGGRPRRITTEDEAFIVETATARPEKLGQPFTRWSIRKLVGLPGRSVCSTATPRVVAAASAAFLKGTSLRNYSQDDLDHVAISLNGRPRETLGWRIPAECLTPLIVATTA